MVTSGPRYRKTARPAGATDDTHQDAIVDDDATSTGDDDATSSGEMTGADNPVDEDADSTGDGDLPTAYEVRMSTYEDEIAARRRSTIANARRKGGVAGAAMAGAMLAVQEIIEAPKEDAPVVVEANSDPEDFEADGITMNLDGTEYHSPPLEPVDER